MNKYGFSVVAKRLQLTDRELNVVLTHEMSVNDGFDDWKEQMRERMLAADAMQQFVSRRTGKGMNFTQVEWMLSCIESRWDVLDVISREVNNWFDHGWSDEAYSLLVDCVMHFRCGCEV